MTNKSKVKFARNVSTTDALGSEDKDIVFFTKEGSIIMGGETYGSTLEEVIAVKQTGFYLVDENYNIGLIYEDQSGFDVQKISDSFLSKVKDLVVLPENLIQVHEDGFYFVDENYNIGGFQKMQTGNLINSNNGISYRIVSNI